MFFFATHEEITESIATLKLVEVTESKSLKADTLLTAAQRVVTVFRALIPFLMSLSSSALFPASWRAGLTLFIQALDVLASVVSATPASPVTASLASDNTTTTDPTSTDPSFKAGKDL